MKYKAIKISTLSALALTGICIPTASAGILLEVDTTNPSAVTITSTLQPSLVDDMSSDLGNGVTLEDLFMPGITVSGLVASSSLIPFGSVQPYLDFSNDWAFLLDSDLNLFSFGQTNDQNFSTTSEAFSGSLTLNLSLAAGSLPAFGATGNIFVGDTDFGSGAIIGQWRAIPEPSSATLLFGLATIAMTRRQRR